MRWGKIRIGRLRERGEGEVEVKPVELFFDLVYVLAVTQVTHYLLEHMTLRGVGETLLLLSAIWGAWIQTVWITNYFDVGTRPVRLMMLGVMFAGLMMSASLPEAFGERGLIFAVSLVAIQVGGTAYLRAGISRHHHLSPVLERVLIWWAIIGVLFLAGGLVHGWVRTAFWLAAVGLEYLVTLLGFPLPVLGHSHTTDYTISGEHLAERCRLFMILALGESILIIGANFGELPIAAETIAAFVVAFIGSVILWWIYFDRTEEAARHIIAAARDPGRLGLSAYTYFHVPMVAGIIAVAAGDELVLAHPTERVTVETAALILGSPALYLAGNALFKWALWGYVPRSRLVAIGALAALIPLAVVATALVLVVAATLVLLAVVLWDVYIGQVGRSITMQIEVKRILSKTDSF